MTLQTMTSDYARMGKRRGVKKVGLANLPTQQTGGNPDGNLKTCPWEEGVPSLKAMVAAAQQVREDSYAISH